MKYTTIHNSFKKVLKDDRQMLSNFAFLALLQAANFIIPLLVVPYLVRVLGIDNFGKVSFAQAVISYLIVLCDYGFNLSATREITIHKLDSKKVSAIFNAVLSTKLLICLFSFILLTFLILLIPKFKADWQLYYLSFSLVIGQALFPIWFFQGIEQMKFITYLSIGAKILFTTLIVVLIQTPSDFIYVNFCLGVGNIAAGLVSLSIVFSRFNIIFSFCTIQEIKQQFYMGWHIFISNLAINIYGNSAVFILGIFTSQTNVGYYSIADKIIVAVKQLCIIFSQAIYPRMCQLAQESHKKLRIFIANTFLPFAAFVAVCCITLFLFSDQIILLLTSRTLIEPILYIRILSLTPIIVAFNIPAYQTLLAYNQKNSYGRVLTIGAIFGIMLNTVLSYFFSSIGTVFSVLITELCVTIGLYIVLEFQHKKYSILKSYR